MVEAVEPSFKEYAIEEFLVRQEPYYRSIGDELELFTAAYNQHIPVLLKGPTGCGKTRFVEYMAWKLGRQLTVVREGRGQGQEMQEGEVRVPLVTIACHEDLTASDLVGRYLLDAEGTRWIDGPMTRAVKNGAILYLDEVVEARKDTTVLIHPLTDHRRILPVEKTGSIIEADDRFLLCISYNPGYQSALKDLKHSTRQRFISIEFYYPPPDIEAEIVERESGCTVEQSQALAKLGAKIRNLQEHGLQEGASTRLLIYAGRLMSEGIGARRACQVAIVWTLSDEEELQRSLEEVVSSIFE
ncbi:MAG: AAA family ATPase [SAR202 cluster bacterium Io17-Chloro-G9]|nr:MAG: AAA family ATPase [SAR202 cluster bacterium Io17-Chloro-G9]